MKIKLLFLGLLICVITGYFKQSVCFSANVSNFSFNSPYYAQYYICDSNTLTCKFNPLSQSKERLLSGGSKEDYKKVKKIESYIESGNFDKAIKTDSNYLPLYVYCYNYYLNKNDYHSAMNNLISIKRVNSIYKILDEDIISYKLGMLYYIEKNYSSALTYLVNFINAHNPSEDNLWFALGDIYFNMNNFDRSIEFLTKIPNTSINYLPAQEILFNDYYALEKYNEASKCAEVLVNKKPTSQNLIRRAATMQASDEVKLDILERAKSLALTSSDYVNLMRADAGIARLEQKKIDNAVNKLNGFVVKPDWQKIYMESEKYMEPVALSRRQENFFKSSNYCINKYSGQDLIKCFEYLNKEEEKISNDIKLNYQQEYLNRIQEQELFQRQQEFLERTYYNRLYMDEFYYMRPPYNYFFWW